MHVPVEKLWDTIPNNVKRAFYNSDAAYFEVESYNNTEFWQNFKYCEENMIDHPVMKVSLLPDPLYQRVQELVARVQNNTVLNLENWKNMTVDDLEYILSYVPVYPHQPKKEIREDLVQLEDCLKTKCPTAFEYNHIDLLSDLSFKLKHMQLFPYFSKGDKLLDDYLEQAAIIMN